MPRCKSCGKCCKLFLINLTEDEYKSKRFKTQFRMFGMEHDFSEAVETASNIIEQKEDGSCIYLKGNKCAIHDKRPKSCRDFFCTSRKEKYKAMIRKINENR